MNIWSAHVAIIDVAGLCSMMVNAQRNLIFQRPLLADSARSPGGGTNDRFTVHSSRSNSDKLEDC